MERKINMQYESEARQELNELTSELRKVGMFKVTDLEEFKNKLTSLKDDLNVLDDFVISETDSGVADIDYQHIHTTIMLDDAAGVKLCAYVNFYPDCEDDEEPEAVEFNGRWVSEQLG